MRRAALVALFAAGACARMPGTATDAGEVTTADAARPADATPRPDADPDSPWNLIWEDEFDGPAGQSPSAENWSPDIGGHGWGNGELQYYTDRPANAALDGEGHLTIVARREEFGGNDYTSARIITANKFDRAYGRFEARIKLPTGQGIWPAFWMLGANFGEVGWPQCGEIDILETRGQQPAVVYGTLHGPGYSGAGGVGGNTVVTAGGHPAESFHLYAVEWRPGVITWFVDDQQYFQQTTSSINQFGEWVYDHPFFLILNVAVGGFFPGPPNDSTPFPQTMLVDYVRVYEAR